MIILTSSIYNLIFPGGEKRYGTLKGKAECAMLQNFGASRGTKGGTKEMAEVFMYKKTSIHTNEQVC